MRRTIEPARQLRGTLRVPGDKSISHRAAMLNALADGEAVVHNFLPADDCHATLRVLAQLGAQHRLETVDGATVLNLQGAGLRGLTEPRDVLDCGNSGTTMRLLSGILAGQPFLTILTGDDSLRTRPMDRIAAPLRQMGAQIDGREDGRLAPLSIRGGNLRGIRYRLPMASAQVKSAVILAALFAQGETTVEEPAPSRDHTERMLVAMGARLEREGPAVRLIPGSVLRPLSMRVPNDISAAAFWMVAATVHPDAELRLEGVGVNPTRSGIIDALRQMGADIDVQEERQVGGEPVADVVVRSSRLHGAVIEGDMIPRLLDEVPVLAVAAAHADGVTEIRDAQELIVKESNRIATTADQLANLGARIEPLPDGMRIHGGTSTHAGGAQSFGDHRLAMALAIAGITGAGAVTLEGAECVAVSYPEFWEDLQAVAR